MTNLDTAEIRSRHADHRELVLVGEIFALCDRVDELQAEVERLKAAIDKYLDGSLVFHDRETELYDATFPVRIENTATEQVEGEVNG